MSDFDAVVECTCEQWVEHSDDIFAAQVFYSMKTGSKWSGGVWSFCPWCGEKLQPTQYAAQITSPEE